MQNRAPIPPHQRPALPDFIPVPRKYRYDGWTPERQRAFIAALAQTGSVKHAAKSINMSPEGAYFLRRQPGADEFRAAWDAALDFGVQSLVDIAIDRAREGVPVPIFHKGEQVGERRRYNDRLLIFILKHHMPSKYGADLHPGTKHPDTIARETAEAEAAAAKEHAEDEDLTAALVKRLHAFGIRTRQNAAEERRALYARHAADPARRAAWELLNERPLESLLETDEPPEDSETAGEWGDEEEAEA